MTEFLLHQLGDWYDETTSTQTTSTERLRKRITELTSLRPQATTRKSWDASPRKPDPHTTSAGSRNSKNSNTRSQQAHRRSGAMSS